MKESYTFRLLMLAVPVAIQSLLFSSRNITDVLMSSNFGVNDVTAIGIAGKYTMLCTILLFGLAIGSGQYLSQSKGSGDKEEFRGYFYTLLSISIPIGFALLLSIWLFSKPLISLYTEDIEIINKGSEYLKIVSFQMPLASIGISYNLGLRSLHKPTISTGCSAIGILINITLNYILIYGKLGFEPMGSTGAAYATLISCIFEITILSIAVNLQRLDIRFSLKDIFKFHDKYKLQFICRSAIPVTISGIITSSGGIYYSYFFSMLGKDVLAAYTVISLIESFLLSFLMGISAASAVLIGGFIGAGNRSLAYKMSATSIKVNLISCLPILLSLMIFRDGILACFAGVGVDSLNEIRKLFYLLIFAVILKSTSAIFTTGILRTGGDNSYCLLVDTISIYFVTLPVMTITYFYYGGSAEVIFLISLLEDATRIIFSFIRYIGKKWINKIT